MTPHFDQTGRLIALETHGTRYSPDALLRAARDAEYLRAAIVAYRDAWAALEALYATANDDEAAFSRAVDAQDAAMLALFASLENTP